jgi:NAD(P)-dependent dehydrogenase (short-subunit alcohol dehydrogenase family)
MKPTAGAGDELVEKRCLVTGASGGIGEEIAAQLLDHGAKQVLLVARASDRLDEARDRLARAQTAATVESLPCDLSLLAEVRALVARVPSPLDVVVLNAAIVPSARRTTREGIEETLATNQLGPYLLARSLLPTMTRGGRIVIVGADPGMLAREPVVLSDLAFENDFSPMRAYMRTKNMNAMFAYALARRAVEFGVTVNAAHPGVIRTSLGRNLRGFAKLALAVFGPLLPTARVGADTPAWLAWSPEVREVTGGFFVKRRRRMTAPHTLDVARQEELWARCAELVSLAP